MEKREIEEKILELFEKLKEDEQVLTYEEEIEKMKCNQ